MKFHRRCLTFLTMITPLILAACTGHAPGMPAATAPLVTDIKGGLGETYAFQWELSSAGGSPLMRQHVFRVTELAPGSPTRSSRSLYLEMTCTGRGSDLFRWGLIADGSPTLVCGDSLSTFVSVDRATFGIQVLTTAGMGTDITYTLRIGVNNPY